MLRVIFLRICIYLYLSIMSYIYIYGISCLNRLQKCITLHHIGVFLLVSTSTSYIVLYCVMITSYIISWGYQIVSYNVTSNPSCVMHIIDQRPSLRFSCRSPLTSDHQRSVLPAAKRALTQMGSGFLIVQLVSTGCQHKHGWFSSLAGLMGKVVVRLN